jgi:hypothetical protein
MKLTSASPSRVLALVLGALGQRALTRAGARSLSPVLGVRDSDRAVSLEEAMDKHRVFRMSFASVYPHYVQKAEKKGRTKKEVDEVICWLTGYSPQALATQIKQKKDFETFFSEAPSLHPNASKIAGVICGVRIQEIEDPLMRKIRYLDKLVDELAKGRAMEKILRK